MAVKEVDESQWLASQNVVRSVTQIMKDPKRRLKLLELQKEAEPDAVIPELDAQKPALDEVKALREEFGKFTTEMKAAREKEENDKKLAEFASKYEKGREMLRSRGFSDDGIKAIEKMMEESGIARHEDGVTVWERDNPPQQPVKSSNLGVTRFLQAGQDENADELTKRLIATKGSDSYVLDRMIEQVRREGQ